MVNARNRARIGQVYMNASGSGGRLGKRNEELFGNCEGLESPWSRDFFWDCSDLFPRIFVHEVIGWMVRGRFFRGDGLQRLNNFLGIGVDAVPKHPDFGFMLFFFINAGGVTRCRG